MVNINHHRWKGDEGMIDWDVKSYYAYLPAAFIYHDLSLDFIDKNPQKFGKWIWPIPTPNGKRGIITSMGLSVMYAPFFFMAHIAATLSPVYEADGYSLPYHFALGFSTFFYFIIALFFLRKILLKYFSERIAALTMFTIGAGTNLFFYVTYAAPMPHGYNFALFILFIYYLIKWHKSINLTHTIVLGLIAGLITLIRPTNIIIVILIPLFGVNSMQSFKDLNNRLLKHWAYVALMMLAFVIVWIPQFAYWYYLSGKIFYFSYGEAGGKFFFNNPQFFNVLLSYRKGWYVYTPLMLLATLGIYNLFKQKNHFALGTSIFLVLNVYIISSWWCWWYGGGFGMRPMIDSYGLMAIPLAALLHDAGRIKWLKAGITVVVFLLILFNLFQIKQYRNQSIHYWWMNKEAYWTNFLKIKPTCKYWQVITIPNYLKAHDGIYEAIPAYERRRVVTDEMLVQKVMNVNTENIPLLDSLRTAIADESVSSDTLLLNYAEEIVQSKQAGDYFQMLKIEFYLNEIKHCASWKKEVEKKAKKRKITFEAMAQIEAERVYQSYCEKYDQQ